MRINKMAKMLGRLSRFLFLMSGVIVFFTVPFSVFWPDFRLPLRMRISVGLSISVAMVFYLVRCRAGQALRQLSPGGQTQDRRFFLLILLLGVSLRVGWVHVVPPVQTVDLADQWYLARNLLERGVYSHVVVSLPGLGLISTYRPFPVMPGEYVLRAWRPPGYPLFLAACMAIVGQQPWLPAVTNIGFYLLTTLVVRALAREVAGEQAALFASLLLALWPEYIAITGLALTEPLSILLFTAGVWALLRAHQHGWRYAGVAGVLTGLGALVRAQLLMLPLVWGLYSIMQRVTRWRALWHTAVAVVAMGVTIAPWTLRNYHVLGAAIPISTNGGSVFYRANNPLASGGWTPQGERDLDAYLSNEVVWNQLGYTWGLEWIKAYPLDFCYLAVKKLKILLEEDTEGIWWALKAAHYMEGPRYEGVRALANLWWLGIWGLAVSSTIRSRVFFTTSPDGWLLLGMVLFWISIHAVFESLPRYHLPFIGVLSVISALALYPPLKLGTESEPGAS
jgi:hypothetical protein